MVNFRIDDVNLMFNIENWYFEKMKDKRVDIGFIFNIIVFIFSLVNNVGFLILCIVWMLVCGGW